MQKIKNLANYLFGNLNWVQVSLLIFGVLAFCGVIFALFFSFDNTTPELKTTALYDVNSKEFLQAVSHLSDSPIRQGSEVKVLNNGDEFLPELLTSLKNAQSTINFSTYIWAKGKMSDQVFAALIERARAGVQVRLLLDGFGGQGAPEDKIKELKDAGGLVDKFRAPTFGSYSRVHKRSHRRAIIIDGSTAFMGGMAISDDWLGNANNPTEWRDTMFEVHGNMAQSVQSAFAQLWSGVHGEILEGPTFYPTSVSTTEPAAAATPYISILSSPANDTEPLPKLFWLSIASAKNKIYLNTPYFLPDKSIIKALKEKARNGVDVRILLPNSHNDSKAIYYTSRGLYKELLDAGVKIYEYQPTMIHSKILTIDGEWSVIGSANMDNRSARLNEENVFGVQNAKLATELTSLFEANLEQSKEIKPDEWNKKRFQNYILEHLFSSFSKQF